MTQGILDIGLLDRRQDDRAVFEEYCGELTQQVRADGRRDVFQDSERNELEWNI